MHNVRNDVTVLGLLRDEDWSTYLFALRIIRFIKYKQQIHTNFTPLAEIMFKMVFLYHMT